ncbi:MAG: carbohydrate-binding protein, partial [Saccharofermentanales bacterium]
MSRPDRSFQISIILTAVISVFLISSVQAAAGGSPDFDLIRNRYLDYDMQYADAAAPARTIEIDPLTYEAAAGASEQIVMDERSVISSGTGFIRYAFNVPETGRYILTFRYIPIAGKNSKIEREIMIDGEYPFDDARNVSFSRIFRYAADYVKTDSSNNEYFNGTEEVFEWTEYSVSDSYGYYNQPFAFYLTAGDHELTLNSVKESMAVSKIRFEPAASIPSYSEYRQSIGNGTGAENSAGSSGGAMVLEAENPERVSDTVLYPGSDRSSPDTTPASAFYLRLNMISGTRWQNAGQWIEWQTDIPQSGLYKISMRVRQNFNDGMFTTRRLLIDGQIPFREADSLTFRYDSAWQTVTAGGEDH